MKTKFLVISRSTTLAPIFLNLLLDGIMVDRMTELKVLSVVFDYKLWFES